MNMDGHLQVSIDIFTVKHFLRHKRSEDKNNSNKEI